MVNKQAIHVSIQSTMDSARTFTEPTTFVYPKANRYYQKTRQPKPISKLLFVCEQGHRASKMAAAIYNGFGMGIANYASIAPQRNDYQQVQRALEEIGLQTDIQAMPLSETLVDCHELIMVFAREERCPRFIRNAPHALFYPVSSASGDMESVRQMRQAIEGVVLSLFHTHLM